MIKLTQLFGAGMVLVVAGVDAFAVPEAAALLATTLPWSSTSATAAKSVWIPKTALKASAWPPVFAGLLSAAVFALAHVSFAV